MNYPNQFTPQAEAATNAIPMYPGHFDEWIEHKTLFVDGTPSVMEMIAADLADYQILVMVNSVNF